MNLKPRRIFLFKIFFALLFVGLILSLILSRMEGKRTDTSVVINNQSWKIEVADSREEKTMGLSGRNSLKEKEGMLFVFPSAFRYPFWMKDMRFNLDFVFVKGEYIVDLAENIPHLDESGMPEEVMAKEDFDKVLEINAGEIDKYNIKIGDKAVIVEAGGGRKISN